MVATAAVEEQYTIINASNSSLCDSHGASVSKYVCAAHEKMFIHALNHDHIYLFPGILKSNTHRRASFYHAAA